MKPTRITLDVWPDGRVEVISKISEESLPTIVTLERSDPDFDRKRKELKERGYVWVKRNQHWRLPQSKASATNISNFENWWGDATEVKLSKGDPDFEKKKDALKAAGATWDGPDQVWVLPEKKPW